MLDIFNVTSSFETLLKAMDALVQKCTQHTNFYIHFQEIQGPSEPHPILRMLPLSNKTEFTWWRWDDSRRNGASNVLAFSKQQTSSHGKEGDNHDSFHKELLSASHGKHHGRPWEYTRKLCRQDPVLMETVVWEGRKGDKQALDMQSSFCIFEPLTVSKGPQKTR